MKPTKPRFFGSTYYNSPRFPTWLGTLAISAALCSTAWSDVPLDNYDAEINNDNAAGLSPAATLAAPVTLTGAGGSAFDFGVISGDGSIELIVEGDPAFNNSAFLAVGDNSVSSLRYEVWNNTGELGFTQGGVADYQFTPGVPSPKKPTHIAYVWDPATATMTLYVNGKVAGTTTGVNASFGLPTGAGWLGANGAGTETLLGTIYRVTTYDSILDAATIRRHSDAFGGDVLPALTGYDTVIAADAGTGLAPIVQQASAIVLPASGQTPFDFGATADDVTMEFVLKGDPSINNSAFLAIGENTRDSLRYELWNNTGQLGFTRGAVADYSFTPGTPSPVQPTHVTYAYVAASQTMKLYINGALAGTTTGVDPAFAMPHGPGFLGANTSGGERMVGIIYRVTVYDDLLEDATILRHARGFTDVLQPPLIASFTSTPARIAAGQPAKLEWSASNTKQVLIDGVDRTTVSTIDVSPEVTTTYVLTAVNDQGTAESKVTVYVDPKLDAYDAAITADAAAGITPAAQLTSAVSLTGFGGAAFDFGTVSEDAAIEFIVEGDPDATVNSYLAVGENFRSNLRFEQWAETKQNGFTLLGVADYLFTPPVPSSAWPTHLTYVWDSVGLTMSVYVNGTLASTAPNISAEFGMPTGPGWLGANPAGSEALVGTIHRVTVYDDPPSPETIKRHADAFLTAARPQLSAYDAVISEAATPPVTRLLAPVVLKGINGFPFDFGTAADDATVEFIVEGNPDASISGFLGVGANSVSSLRYEVWENTGELGFTQGGVADYQFTPGVPSPRTATHVAYVWQPGTASMQVFLDGALVGTTTGVSAEFQMPAGVGALGATSGGSEAMTGTIHRVTVYDEVLSAEVLLGHAQAFLGTQTGPVLTITVTQGSPTLLLAQGVSGQHYRLEYRETLATAGAWTTLIDIPSLNGTSIQVVDSTPATGKAERYYRAVKVQ
jgi:hypothetical protein